MNWRTIFIIILICLFGWILWVNVIQPMTDISLTPSYSYTLQFKVNVAQEFNESGTSPTLDTASIKVYQSGVLRESGSCSSGIYTSSNAYSSGDRITLEVSASGFETRTFVRTVPHYSSSGVPTYHYLDSISTVLTPSIGIRAYADGVQNTTAKTTITDTAGNIRMEFYTNTDDSKTYNYEDLLYGFERQYIVVITMTGSTNADPDDVILSTIDWNVQTPTSAQDGIAVFLLGTVSLDAKTVGSDVRNNFDESTNYVNSVPAGAASSVNITVHVYSGSNLDYYLSHKSNPTGASLVASGILFSFQHS